MDREPFGLEHPTVKALRGRPPAPSVPSPLDAAWLREPCLEAGADDVGFVELERPALAGERPRIERAFPRTRSLISLSLSGRGYRRGWHVQFFRLLHAQLPGVHERVCRLG